MYVDDCVEGVHRIMRTGHPEFSLVFGGLILDRLALNLVLRLLVHRKPLGWSYAYPAMPTLRLTRTIRAGS